MEPALPQTSAIKKVPSQSAAMALVPHAKKVTLAQGPELYVIQDLVTVELLAPAEMVQLPVLQNQMANVSSCKPLGTAHLRKSQADVLRTIS